MRGRCSPDCMSFPEEATHPRYYGEGYPDWPGRASNKEGEWWTSIAGLSSESIRQSCAMRLRSRRMVEAAAPRVFGGALTRTTRRALGAPDHRAKTDARQCPRERCGRTL